MSALPGAVWTKPGLAAPSLEDRLAAARNRPSGFDYMRLTLATLIVCLHSITVCYGREVEIAVLAGPVRPLFALVLPMFFALSGFLVAGSLERCRTIISFAGLRVLRIVPALAVDTLLSALLLGSLFTTLALGDYFADPMFRGYFLNIAGIVHYYLPGVFADNPLPGVVNQQLWTLPYELKCYIAVVGLAFVGVVQRPRLLVLFTVMLNVWAVLFGKEAGFGATTVHGYVLVQCFLYGVCLFLLRRSIPFNAALAGVSAVLTLALLSVPAWDAWAALPATYLTVYLGLLQPPRTVVVNSGDYSYGIFLYGFPIQQAMYAMFGGQHWLANIAVSLPATVLLAMFSWWCVEKPMLRLRPALLNFEDAVLRLSGAIPLVNLIVPALSARQRSQRKAA